MLLNDRNSLPGKTVSFGGTIVLIFVFMNATILKFAFVYNENLYLALFVTLPLLLASAIYYRQQKTNNFKQRATQARLMDEQPLQREKFGIT
jgi:hypothetical protein